MGVSIRGIQRKAQYVGSTKGHSNYDDRSHCKEFVVKKLRHDDGDSFEVFFPQFTNPEEGVGLELPSSEVAIAVGRALLMVSEGYTDEVSVRLQERIGSRPLQRSVANSRWRRGDRHDEAG